MSKLPRRLGAIERQEPPIVYKEGPIIVVGAGRTGSTVFHHMLSEHPSLAWLPGRICNRFPKNSPALSRLFMQGLDYPVVGESLKRLGNPDECYSFWERYCKGFTTPHRDLVARDVTERTRKQIRKAMSQVTTEKRNRLLLKITGWPRIGFLSEIFENATFIHLLRDGRAVVNSMINMDFWWGWRGSKNWILWSRWAELSPTQKAEWDKHGQSFIVLAAIQWKILMDAVENAKSSVDSDRFLEVRYEDLCSDPIGHFKHIADFCALKWTTGFESELRKYQLRNTNDKYKRELTAEQQAALEEVLEDYLRRYNYVI